MERDQLTAVHESDLEGVLAKLGVLETLRREEILCVGCGKPVSLASLGCLFGRNGRVQVCCDDPACLERVIAGATEDDVDAGSSA
jgi:hypothetical protein